MPVTVLDGINPIATQFETQRKVFRNPRGLKYFYALFVDNTDYIYIYKSVDGSIWSNAYYAVPIVRGTDPSFWIYEDVASSKLIVHMTYQQYLSNNVVYERLEIADSGSAVSAVGTEQIVDSADDGNFKPMIFLGTQGYLHVVYEKDIKSKGKNFYHVYIKSTTSTYPTMEAPTWGTASVVYTNATQDARVWGTGSTLISTYEGLILTYNVNYIYGKYFGWDGSSYIFGTQRNTSTVSGPSVPSIVADESNYGFFIYMYNSAFLRIVKWTVGVGFGSPLEIVDIYPNYFTSWSLGIDKTSAINRLIAFYTKSNVSGDVFYKTADVDYTGIGDWSSENVIDDDSEICKHLSCSYEDWNGDSKIQLIYTTQTTHLVRFVEITLAVIPTLWKALQYFTEPPSEGWNKLRYASEPPITDAWNKILYEDE